MVVTPVEFLAVALAETAGPETAWPTLSSTLTSSSLTVEPQPTRVTTTKATENHWFMFFIENSVQVEI
jgi:hypothetical protein